MKKNPWKLNFVRTSLLLGIFLVFSAQSRADEGVPFTIAGETSDTIVPELKEKAIRDYLSKQLGTRFTRFADRITPEFADSYILDYEVQKKSGKIKTVEVTGHIDGKSLLRWVRLQETKSQTGGAIKTGFAITSEIPQFEIKPQDTATRVADQATAKVLYQLSSLALEKFNASLTSVKDGRFPGDIPAKRDSDIRALKDYGAAAAVNTLIWAHLTPCPSCGGVRLTLYFYNLFQDRIAITKTQNGRLELAQLTSGNGVKEAFEPGFLGFQKELEETISSGALSSRILILRVEQIPTYKAFQTLQRQVPKLDYIPRANLKTVEAGSLEYEIYSPLTPKEMSQRIQKETLGGFSLEEVSVDTNRLVMRYLGKG